MENEIKELIQLLSGKLKSVIIVHWKDSGKIIPYKNLSVFVEQNPKFNYETVNSYIGRKDQPYTNDEVTICRAEIVYGGGKTPKKGRK